MFADCACEDAVAEHKAPWNLIVWPCQDFSVLRVAPQNRYTRVLVGFKDGWTSPGGRVVWPCQDFGHLRRLQKKRGQDIGIHRNRTSRQTGRERDSVNKQWDMSPKYAPQHRRGFVHPQTTARCFWRRKHNLLPHYLGKQKAANLCLA